MKFVVAVLSLIVAEEIVQLDPVAASALYDDYPCSHWNSDATQCRSKPFCFYAASTCKFDTCLMAAADTWTTDADCYAANNDNQSCKYVSTNIAYKDDTTCTNPNTPTPRYRYVCRYSAGGITGQAPIDSCTYEYLRSNKTACDSWNCVPKQRDAAGKDYCGAPSSRSNSNCADLPEAYCSLNPHCYWQSSICTRDTCTDFNSDCDTHTNTNNANAVCSSYNIFDGASATAGTTKIMCVDKNKNAAPNKCFDLAEGGTENGNRPSTGTGLCKTYTLPKCSANEECAAQFSGSGPFGAYYCGDATHNTENFSIVAHSPSVVMILLAVLAFFL